MRRCRWHRLPVDAARINAALTGHKVLTTFHTEDSIGGLIRLLNMNIEAFLISSTVVSVMAQRLLRKLGFMVAIDGDFDEAQARVKDMFNDFAFRDGVRLAGVNSINWARVLAQVVYYFSSAVSLGAPHREVSFTVPTGNFGDIFAGYIARKMGLPAEFPGSPSSFARCASLRAPITQA